MVSKVPTCLAVIFTLYCFPFVEPQNGPEDCGDIQNDVENGIIRLPDFSGESIRDLNCSWTYTAPPGRMLLIKVDSLQISSTTHFQMTVDDTFYEIPRTCVKCLKKMVAGKILNVIFTSSSVNDSIGSFQIRYKSFDPHRCGRPEQIDNGYIVNKGRKVGQSLFYHCNPPFDIIGNSELKCIVTDQVPEWSDEAPKCWIPDCTDGPIRKQGISGSIASPGFPSYQHEFTVPCLWEVIAQPNQQIKVSVTYLKLPRHTDNSFSENISRLSLFDGHSYILNLTETITGGPLNFTTSTNILNVEFVVETESKKKETIGFYLEYSIITNSCPKPQEPQNGGVIIHNLDLGSVIAYSCKQGYVLVGQAHAECLYNLQWSHPTPSCEQLNESPPPFIMASNDSDTVIAKLPDISPKSEKKSIEPSFLKEATNFTEKKTVPKVKPTTANKSFKAIENVKKSQKQNGPKSEPHLLSPKESPKKSSPVEEDVPSEIDIFGFQVNRLLLYVLGGVGIPLCLIIILLVIIVIYRRKYPVRMRFGRKFSTFENPMYVSKDVQHPRELTRLTN